MCPLRWINISLSNLFLFTRIASCLLVLLIITPWFRTLPDTKVPELIRQTELNLSSERWSIDTTFQRLATFPSTIFSPWIFLGHTAFSLDPKIVTCSFARLLPCSLYQGLLGLHIMNHQFNINYSRRLNGFPFLYHIRSFDAADIPPLKRTSLFAQFSLIVALFSLDHIPYSLYQSLLGFNIMDHHRSSYVHERGPFLSSLCPVWNLNAFDLPLSNSIVNDIIFYSITSYLALTMTH